MEKNKNINITDLNSTSNHNDIGTIFIEESDSVKIRKSMAENNLGDTLGVYTTEKCKSVDVSELECRNNKNKESGCIHVVGFKSGSD